MTNKFSKGIFMNKPWRYGLVGATTLAFALVASAAQAAPGHAATTCANAWSAYNDFKSRTVMEPPSKYALTVQGAAVRAACGKSALPVPAGSARPPRHHIPRNTSRGSFTMHPPFGRSSGPATGRRLTSKANSGPAALRTRLGLLAVSLFQGTIVMHPLSVDATSSPDASYPST